VVPALQVATRVLLLVMLLLVMLLLVVLLLVVLLLVVTVKVSKHYKTCHLLYQIQGP
jgi:hypothetical protein